MLRESALLPRRRRHAEHTPGAAGPARRARLVRRERRVDRSRWRARGTLLPLVTLGCVNIVSLFFLFYRGLNILASLGCGSIGYPVAMGSCIAGFLIYSRAILREKAGFAAAAAFLAVLSGILVISL